MAKTFSNLQVGVRIYLDEAQQADFLDSEVQSRINLAYQDVISKVMEVYEQYYETTTPFTYALVQNQQEYTVDSTLIKITRVEVNYAPNISGSVPVRAVAVKMDEDLINIGNLANQGAVFNAGYYIHGSIGTQTIGLIPIPQVSDTTAKSLSVWGIATPPDLVNASDNVNIPYADRFSNLVELKAAAYLLSKGQQDESSSTKYHALFAQGILEMQTFIKERQADGPWMIQDIEVENIDFESPFPW